MIFRRRFSARSDGQPGCRLRLSVNERLMFKELPDELISVLSDFGQLPAASQLPPGLRRLFPTAFTRDEAEQKAFTAKARPELLEHHLEALKELQATASADVLDEEQMYRWLSAINELRLVLGTVLDISEDESDLPDWDAMSYQMQLYYYLNTVQSDLIDYVSGTLPPPREGADDEVPDDPWGEPIGGLRWDGTPIPPGGPDDR
jgi:hypothetical protein